MYYPDHHVHTFFSSDSEEGPENHIERGIALGMPAICFTDHHDPHYPKENGFDFQLEPAPYLEKIRELSEHYAGKIQVSAGVEVGLQTAYVKETTAYMKDHPWDFIIGSIHLIDGQDPYVDSYFAGKSEEKAYRRYFEVTLENLTLYEPAFDVLGHLDYIYRLGGQHCTNAWQSFPELMDEILHRLVEKGIGLDINTGGRKKGLSCQHPHDDLLRRYRELGGELITIGSDAHQAAALGAYFPETGERLKALGFRYVASFCGRKPEYHPL